MIRMAKKPKPSVISDAELIDRTDGVTIKWSFKRSPTPRRTTLSDDQAAALVDGLTEVLDADSRPADVELFDGPRDGGDPDA
jgi:hypothetical protein